MRAARKNDDSGHVAMTSMIDVVFLLLIFFLLIIAMREALLGFTTRQAVEAPIPRPATPSAMVRIDVLEEGYRVNGRQVDAPGLDRMLTEIGRFGCRLPVLVACREDALHDRFIYALDMCHKAEFEKVSVANR